MKPRCDNDILLYLQKFVKVTFTLLKLSFSVVFIFLMELSEGQGIFFLLAIDKKISKKH